MAGFKEAGQFSEVQVPPEYRDGGINMVEGYSVRHPNFRLRPDTQVETQDCVSAKDLDPVLLIPDQMKGLRLPENPSTVYMGMEVEFSVIDIQGAPADLYGKDKIVRSNGNLQIDSTGNPWEIDFLGGSPECLRNQIEINAPKSSGALEMVSETIKRQQELIRRADQRGFMLLPTGLYGLKLKPGWDNVPPHPYIMKVHYHSLGSGGQTFDGMSIQHHVDLTDYGGSLEHALYIGNQYNNLLASMLAGLTTSSPFHNGQITGLYSNRESARHTLATRGGVQATDYQLDGKAFIQNANRLIKAGVIPVPERGGNYLDSVGNGSHKDYRPKISLCTGEFCACDMTPNPLLQAAEGVILRRFVHKMTEYFVQQEPLPRFLGRLSPEDRIYNRDSVSISGNNAVLRTAAGNMHISETWSNMQNWLWESDSFDSLDANLSHTAVDMALDVRYLDGSGEDEVANYFDMRSQAFMRGNFSAIMIGYAKTVEGKQETKINKTNLEVARRYREFILSKSLDSIF